MADCGMSASPSLFACGNDKSLGSPPSQHWSQMSASTCVSSRSGSSCASENGDVFCLNGKRQSFVDLLEVKSTFLQFPTELLELDVFPSHRRARSVPCRIAGDFSHDDFTSRRACGASSSGKSSVGGNTAIRLPFAPTLTPPPPPAAPPTLRLSEFLTLVPSQPLKPLWPAPAATSAAATPVAVPFGPSDDLANVVVFNAPLADGEGQSLGSGDSELVSAGSLTHYFGNCQPCAFVRKTGCANGVNCNFCHICGPEVRRRRQLDRLDQKRREYRLKKKQEAFEKKA